MSLLTGLFGGGSTTDKIVAGVMDGVDAAFYTDEEKSRAAQKVLDFKLEWMKATQGQNIARRLIASAVTGMWLMCGMIAIAARILGHGGLYEDMLVFMSDVINTPFMLIMSFYFAAHVLKGIRK